MSCGEWREAGGGEGPGEVAGGGWPGEQGQASSMPGPESQRPAEHARGPLACGVDTMTAPERRSRWLMLSCASPAGRQGRGAGLGKGLPDQGFPHRT